MDPEARNRVRSHHLSKATNNVTGEPAIITVAAATISAEIGQS